VKAELGDELIDGVRQGGRVTGSGPQRRVGRLSDTPWWPAPSDVKRARRSFSLRPPARIRSPHIAPHLDALPILDRRRPEREHPDRLPLV
jgi:hypothetical protein